MNSICGLNRSSAGIQFCSMSCADLRTAGIGRHRHIDHVRALGHGTAVRVQRVLEEAAHQHALVAGDDVLGAVAVVHVEVDDRDPLQAVYDERMARRHGHVVEEAEAHRLRRGWRGGRAGAPRRRRSRPAPTAPGRWPPPRRRRRAARPARCRGRRWCQGPGRAVHRPRAPAPWCPAAGSRSRRCVHVRAAPGWPRARRGSPARCRGPKRAAGR